MAKQLLYISALLMLLCVPTITNAQLRNIDDKIWEFVKKEYPTDEREQEYQFKKQKDAFVSLYGVKDYEVKRFAEKKYFDDYIKQLDTYNKQVEAKEFMQNATNKKAKESAVKKYPGDYEAQKAAYELLIK